MHPKIAEKLEEKIAEIIVKMGLKKLPLSNQYCFMMLGVAVITLPSLSITRK